MRVIDLWLAKYWTVWRSWFNARETRKALLDFLLYGQSFIRTDIYGRRIRICPAEIYQPPPSEESKHE
jgi:hypothetical protein